MSSGDRLWLVFGGRFTLRTPGGRRVLDPSTMALLRDGTPYQVRHEREGGDVCLSVRGEVASALVARGDGFRPVSALAWVALHRAVAALDEDDRGALLQLEEALAEGLAAEAAPRRTPRTSPRTRALAEELAEVIRLRFDERLTLSDLAASAGVSPFHACAAFRAATGTTLHGHLMEVRLHPALAGLLDTAEPVAQIAAGTGFASQAHLTTRFRRRFGVTPAACRREGRIGAGARATG